MGSDSGDRATKLAAFLQRWLREHPDWSQHVNRTTFEAEWRGVAEVSAALLADAEFAELRFAPILMSPDGDLVRTAVSRVLPRPESYEFRLLTEAIIRAASAQTQGERKAAAHWTGVAAVMVVSLCSSFAATTIARGKGRRARR